MRFINIPTTIQSLGIAKIPSPIHYISGHAVSEETFISDDNRILINANAKELQIFIKANQDVPTFEVAGPRKEIYFDPRTTKCALVTCGGLCPGLNDIIRSVFLELYHRYGVKNVVGIRYGLQGLIPKYGHGVIELTPGFVSNIHKMGGTILGSSRGPQPIDEVVDTLERMNINILFMVGGDGTLVAADSIAEEVLRRKLKIAVVGIPKTIDNDIFMVARSFGFDTAVDLATQVIRGAHNESTGYPNGIGLIKFMGRHSGFITATAALAQQDVNFVLIPEVDFDLYGENGLLASLEKRLESRGHAVIITAEGAGQKYFKNMPVKTDPSGNKRLNDIGLFLKEKISSYFRKKGLPVTLKYIDPSYTIRSLPANSNDNVFCNFLGRDAVHAAMAGKTRLLIGFWNNHFVHVPMGASAGKSKQVTPNGKLWLSVLGATGQGTLKNSE